MDQGLRRDAPRRPAAIALGAASAALAVTLLVPRLFSDPNGLDPHVLRLAGVSAVLAGASLVSRRLAPARPVLLALAAVSLSFSLFSAIPGILRAVAGPPSSGAVGLFWASLAQALATLALAWASRRAVPGDLRPDLRLRHLGRAAAMVSVVGIALLIPVGLAVPAPLLGREGIALQAVLRDIGWLGPACALQAFAQELQFRGLLMGALERVAPARAANLAQAGLFALAHLAIQYPGPLGPFIPVAFGVGLILAWIVQRTGSLWPAVAIHAAADIGITVTVLPGLYGL